MMAVHCSAQSHSSKATGHGGEQGGGILAEDSLMGMESEPQGIHSLSSKNIMQSVLSAHGVLSPLVKADIH